jgi:TP53 regulating kinase and related kinases
MPPKLLYQGAEAKIFLSNKEDFIIKDRIKKAYRIKELDEQIRKHRTKTEAKLLTKASKIINAPKPFFVPDLYQIKMPYIKGKRLSENLDTFPLKKQKQIMKVVGEQTAKLHDNEIIHGDLTTSNMILVGGKENIPALQNFSNDIEENSIDGDKRLVAHKQHDFTLIPPSKSISAKRGDISTSDFTTLTFPKVQRGGNKSPKVFFIDFGLGFISIKAEDKAVDIHLLKQALEAKHFRNWQVLFEEFLKGYKSSKQENKVLERLKEVEKRGRYRH